jgi:NAD(P)-dependent dehydrogenase (short-subunit alcohol dehydrogenase family)
MCLVETDNYSLAKARDGKTVVSKSLSPDTLKAVLVNCVLPKEKIMRGQWTQEDMPDLRGKIVVVTGANSGLGFESTKELAKHGATVVMAVRNMTKGEKARAEILQEVPGAKLDLMTLDNADLGSVHNFAEAFKNNYDRLDILLNNAGLMAVPRQETVDGFEMQLGVNHLAHFALTGLLLDVIIKTPGARIHNVSSTANFRGAINFDDLMGKEKYSRWGAYGQSKLANVFFTFELDKRLKAAGLDTMMANVSHPGLVIGNLQANSVEQSSTRMEAVLYQLSRLFLARDVSKGVQPMLYGMTAEEAKSGVLYGPKYIYHLGPVAETKANDAAYDEEALRRFWEISETLTGVTFDFKQPESSYTPELSYAN